MIKPFPKPNTMPPFLRPKIKRLPERKRVTIIAGFLAQEGWVLAADSQEIVSDYSKNTTQKIRVFTLPSGWRIAFAGAASNAGYADMLQSEILGEIAAAKGPDFKTLKKIVCSRVLHLHKQHFWIRKSPPSVQALILLQGPGDTGEKRGVALLATNDSAVFGVTDYHAIGVGSYMADYLRPLCFQDRRLPAEVVENLAIHILKQVKTAISGCDGETIIATFGFDGTMRFKTQPEVLEVERAFAEYQRALKPIIFSLAFPRMPDRYLQSHLKHFSGELTDIHARQLQEQAVWDKQVADFEAMRKVAEQAAREQKANRKK